MRRSTIIFLIIFLIPSISSGFGPYFKGGWGDTPNIIKELETRELIKIHETSVKDFQNVILLEYAESAPEQEIIVNYLFNDDKLELVSWTMTVNNANEVSIKKIFDDFNNNIINKLDNATMAGFNKVNDKYKLKAVLIKNKNTRINILSQQFFINPPKFWCSISFFNKDNSFNTEVLNVFNETWDNITSK